MHIAILINLYSHEDREQVIGELLKAIHTEFQKKTRYIVIEKVSHIKNLGPGVLVVTDDLHRFASDVNKVIQIVLDLLQSGNELWIPGVLDLRKAKNGLIKQDIAFLELLSLFASIKHKTKSARIKQSLFVKKQLKGAIHESSKLTPEMKSKVIEKFKEIGGIRAVSRELGISPASVSRIIKEWKNE